MDSIPPEILRDIFHKTLPIVPDEFFTPHSESISAPLRVSHVCRSWREIALSFRELWSYLYLNHMSFCGPKTRMMVEIFDTWLARSNDGPLNYRYYGYLPESGATTQDHESAEYIFTTLIENQYRWKDVFFSCYVVKFSSRFPGFNLTNMPLLSSMVLHLDYSLHPVISLKSSSRLRRLVIRNDDFDMVASSTLPHLEDVRLHFTSTEPHHQRIEFVLSCLELFRNAPSLRRASISTLCKDHQSPLTIQVDGERTTLTNLRELFLMGGSGCHLLANVVDSMKLPSLERLIYGGTAGWEKLAPLFQRSASPLTYLRLRCEYIPDDELIGILKLLPNLQDLKLCGARLSDRFFRGLIVTDVDNNDRTSASEQIVCPRLSRFEIDVAPRATLEWSEPLRAMAKSRAFILGTFKTIELLGGGRRIIPPIDIADIDELVGSVYLSAGIVFQ